MAVEIVKRDVADITKEDLEIAIEDLGRVPDLLLQKETHRKDYRTWHGVDEACRLGIIALEKWKESRMIKSERLEGYR